MLEHKNDHPQTVTTKYTNLEYHVQDFTEIKVLLKLITRSAVHCTYF